MAEKNVIFICQHGAFRSRIAAAYFNASAPPGWRAASAGITPQSEVSTRLVPLMNGTEGEPFIDLDPPRRYDANIPARTIVIDADAPGDEIWHTSSAKSDEELRGEIRELVRALIRRLSHDDAGDGRRSGL
jgi:hypothetical protein